MSNLARKGSFTAKAVGGRLLVLRSEVESFVPRPKGRPIKEAQMQGKTAKTLPKMDMTDSAKYVSQAEAARLRGVSKQAIANLIHRGRLSSINIAGRTLVIRSEVEAFVPQPLGHPPTAKTNTRTAQPKRPKR